MKKAREPLQKRFPGSDVEKVKVQEALLPLKRRRDYCRSPRSFRVTPAGFFDSLKRRESL